jgi:carbon monoxide dehydrogenase subunit G
MDISGEQRIPASRQQVWKALNNPNVLKKCIPNCESLDKKSPTEMVATIKVKIAFLSASFKSNVTLTNLNAPESYTIITEGSSMIVGSIKSHTDVHLREENAETVVHYTIGAEFGGKLAMLGSKMADGSAKKAAQKFFEKLGKIVVAKNETAATAAAAPSGA